jgi:hypothetical protein
MLLFSTFYRVEAKLVPDSSALQIYENDLSPPAPVYDAVLVSPILWWKRRQGIILPGLFGVCALVITLALVLSKKPDPPEPPPPKPMKLHPRHSTTCATLRDILFETDCDDCQHNISISQNTVTVAKNNDFVQFLSGSRTNDILKLTQQLTSTTQPGWLLLPTILLQYVAVMIQVEQVLYIYLIRILQENGTNLK